MPAIRSRIFVVHFSSNDSLKFVSELKIEFIIAQIYLYIFIFGLFFTLLKAPNVQKWSQNRTMLSMRTPSMDSTCSLFSFFRHATRDSFFTFFFKRFPLSDQQQLKFDIQLVAAARWEEPADSDQNNILWHLKKKSYSTFFLGFSSSFFCVTGFGAVFV